MPHKKLLFHKSCCSMKLNTISLILAFGLTACTHTAQSSVATQNSTQNSNNHEVRPSQNHEKSDAGNGIRTDQTTTEKPVSEPVNTHDACFHQNHKISEKLVVSSIDGLSVDGKELWAAQTPEGEVKIYKRKEDAFENRSVAQNAQIACLDNQDSHFRLGWIARNAQDGTFKLEIHEFNGDIVENRDELWIAATRGFMPDAGTKCAFLGRRDLIVVGTRPRGDHVPLHGFFHLQSRALKLIEGTSEHVPLLESAVQKDGKTQLLMRTVERDGDNKPHWPFGVYKLIDAEEDAQLEKEFGADFIVADSDQWLSFDKSGCLLKDGASICPDKPIQVREIRALPGMCEDAVCVEMLTYQENWIAKIQSDSVNLIAIPSKIRLLKKTLRSTNEWLIITMDEARPDMTDGLEFVEIDMNCLGI